MNIDKAKRRSKQLPPVPRSKPIKKVKEPKVIERVIERTPEPEPEEAVIEPIEIEVEVTIEPEDIIESEIAPEREIVTRTPVKTKPKQKQISRKSVRIPKQEVQVIKQVLDQLDENELPLSTVVFGADRSSKHSGYSFDDKFTAISLMRAFADDKNGVMTPNFARMSRLLNVSTEALSSWWSQRSEIIASSQGVVSEMKTIVSYELSWLLIESISELRKRMKEKADDMKEESLIKIIDRVVNKLSILSGDPTRRKRVDVHHHIPVQGVPPQDA